MVVYNLPRLMARVCNDTKNSQWLYLRESGGKKTAPRHTAALTHVMYRVEQHLHFN